LFFLDTERTVRKTVVQNTRFVFSKVFGLMLFGANHSAQTLPSLRLNGLQIRLGFINNHFQRFCFLL